MIQHEFAIMDFSPVKGNIYEEYEAAKYDCVSVSDESLTRIESELGFMNCFWHSLDKPQKGLCYYGITLIPPTEIEIFIEIIQHRQELFSLKQLLLKASKSEKYIIHFGI